MQPTEKTPSTDVQQPSLAASEEPSEQAEERASPAWWNRIFRRGAEPDPAEQEEASAQQQPAARTMTEEEFHRSVQAEVDRREYKRQKDAEEAERKRLRDEDPWAYAEQERAAEQARQSDTQIDELFANISRAHDGVTLDPLMQRLGPEERERIMKLNGAGIGLDGRRLVADEALKALEKHWRAEGAKDAETKLRKNPVFRKQVFAELRGSQPEPEFLPSGPTRDDGRGGEQINDWLRGQIGIHRQM
jgi:hypothetical protein